jgi:hypothetical protein
MVQLRDIHSLTDFLRNHKEHIERLKKAGRPEVLTINGKAELVVQDAASYQKLLDALDHVDTIRGIVRGLEDVKAGRSKPAKQFFEDMRKKFDIPSA